jgi:hypothetical protein
MTELLTKLIADTLFLVPLPLAQTTGDVQIYTTKQARLLTRYLVSLDVLSTVPRLNIGFFKARLGYKPDGRHSVYASIRDLRTATS